MWRISNYNGTGECRLNRHHTYLEGGCFGGLSHRGSGGHCAGGVFLLQSDILVLKHTVMSVFDISYKYTKKKKGPCEVP